MSQQKQNPKVEWGFYATVPRIVRTGPKYQDISHAAKWLYTCLKDLCGNHGSCFRALRTLSEETGISTGSLSTMIRELHDVGLIHAEKKSRGKGGKEVWHISVVDIWQANREYCSKIEQLSDGDVHILNNTLPVVQNMNDVVQKLNEPPPSCSENERSCSNFDDRRIDSEEQRYEARTGEEERAASSQSNEHARAFDENDYHFYGTERQHHIWNCHNWCAAEHGTCEDYVTAIENGWQEAKTDKMQAVKIGATDATLATNPADRDRSGGRTPADNTDRSPGVPDDLHPGGSVRRDGVELETPQSPALRAAGSPQPQVAIASTPGRAAAPPAATVPHSLQGPQDGAATDGGSESRASHGDVTQEKLRILDDWDKVQGQPVPRIRRHMEAALALVTAHPTREELAGCQKWLPETDNPKTLWYHKRGVGLWDVAEKLGLYRNHLALSIEPAPLADVKRAPAEAPVKRWNAAEHRKMLKEFEARERRELEAKQQNLQA